MQKTSALIKKAPKSRKTILNLSCGFAFIEIVVILSFVSVIASALIAYSNVLKAATRDDEKITQAKQIKVALHLYYKLKGRMPGNYYKCNNNVCSFSPSGGGNAWAYESGGTVDSWAAYQKSMQEMVDAGIITVVPESPGYGPYGYFDSNPNDSEATFGAVLETNVKVNPNLRAPLLSQM